MRQCLQNLINMGFELTGLISQGLKAKDKRRSKELPNKALAKGRKVVKVKVQELPHKLLCQRSCLKELKVEALTEGLAELEVEALAEG